MYDNNFTLLIFFKLKKHLKIFVIYILTNLFSVFYWSKFFEIDWSYTSQLLFIGFIYERFIINLRSKIFNQ
jgi:hypothetical protein